MWSTQSVIAFTWGSRAMNKKVLFILILFTLCAHSEEIPVANFAHQPLIEQPVISPGGAHIAAVLNARRAFLGSLTSVQKSRGARKQHASGRRS
jgi:hypothetical protein